MKPTLVVPQSPSGYGKVPFATSGPPNSRNTGNNHKNNYKNIMLEISSSTAFDMRSKPSGELMTQRIPTAATQEF